MKTFMVLNNVSKVVLTNNEIVFPEINQKIKHSHSSYLDILTIKFYGFGFSVVSSILLSIIAILIIIFLSRKTKKGEIISIILSVVFALGLYGSLMLSSLFAQMK